MKKSILVVMLAAVLTAAPAQDRAEGAFPETRNADSGDCTLMDIQDLLRYIFLARHQSLLGDSVNYDRCDGVDVADLAYRFQKDVLQLCPDTPVCSSITGGAITLRTTAGLVADGRIAVGRPLTFVLHISNLTEYDVNGITHGFRFYSNDGAVWHPPIVIDSTFHIVSGWDVDTLWYDAHWIDYPGFDWYGDDPQIFDGGAHFSGLVADHDGDTLTPHTIGVGSDTMGFGGFVATDFSLGLVPGLDTAVWQISIDSVSSLSAGKTLCLDSATYPVAGYWKWSAWQDEQAHAMYPSWDGPHCFEIVADCCEGPRGNVNLDLEGSVNVSDLTYLVGWMFGEKAEPPCMFEADVNGDSSHNVEDLTHLVGYMFKDGSPPAACP